MRRITGGCLAFAAASVLFLAAGCNNSEELRQQRIAQADKHFDEISKRVTAPDKVFTLPDCIEAAIKNNLDIKLADMKEAIAKERRTAEMLGMLPELNIREDMTHRNNQPGSSSESLITGQQSLEPSKSSQRDEAYTKVELALSTLDFGLAYFNSIQADDKVSWEKQQKMRTAQNLVLDVVAAYFKVAGTQYAIERTERLIAMGDKIDKSLDELSKDKTISPLRALDERKRFINLKMHLMEYRRNYENSCVELRSLMGYCPSKEIKVDTACLEKLNLIKLPEIDALTRMALNERPELYQIDLQHHMTVIEARKAVLMMFPNVRAFYDFTNSTNKYLYNQSWWEVGARAAYNLFKLPAQIKQYQAFSMEADEMTTKALVLSIGVMAQVRIAHANMVEQKERYELQEKAYDAYKEHLAYAESNADTFGRLSQLEIVRLEIETAGTSIDRAHALSNYYLSYYRLLNTVGIEAIDQKAVEETLDKLETKANQEELRKLSECAKNKVDMGSAVDVCNTLSDYEGKKLVRYGFRKNFTPTGVTTPEQFRANEAAVKVDADAEAKRKEDEAKPLATPPQADVPQRKKAAPTVQELEAQSAPPPMQKIELPVGVDSESTLSSSEQQALNKAGFRKAK